MSERSTENPFAVLSRHLTGIVVQYAPHLLAVSGRGRVNSSGFVWRSGVVVTASDALERDEDISVLSPGGERISATLAGRDPTTDIAVLRVPGTGSPLARMRDDQVSTGELAVAIGRHSEGPIASFGMIATASGPWQSLRGGRIDRLVRLDRGIDRRQEGGVVVSATGDLIGMAVAGPRQGALAIPMETIERVADQLLARGHIARGYLGLRLQPVRLDDALVQSCSLPSSEALLVVGVDANGPGRRAGLLIGDIITTWSGEPVRNVREVFRRLGAETVGQNVGFSFVRAGQTASARIEISERPMS